tara:strand:- start:452 stop:730 length:279 start_codon:yes stop_codon:yes gene_type:complete
MKLQNQVSVKIGKQTRTFFFDEMTKGDFPDNPNQKVWCGISPRTKKGAPKAGQFMITENGELDFWYSFNIADYDKNCFPNGFKFEPKEAPSI